MNPSRLFIERPVATTLLSVGIALAGSLAFRMLPVSPLPAVDFPTIAVSAGLPGASPETMAATVATPLERALGEISGITEMTSSSSLGSTRITMQFDLARDIDGAARDVQAAINNARALLPTNLPSNPTYRKINPADSPILILALTSDTMSRGQLYDAADTILAQKLSQVAGVGQASVAGSSQPAVRVELNPKALNQYSIGTEAVRTAITTTNANRPKGLIEAGGRHWQIGANDQALRAREYRPIIVSYVNGSPVRLGDVAEVIDSVQDLRNAGLSNGKPAVMVFVFRQPNANIIDTVDRIRALLPQLEASMPRAVNLDVVIDRTPPIRASLKEVEQTLALSVVLVVLVVFIFLRRATAAVVPAVAVPVSLIGTFAIMYLAGFSLDNLSLMALTIATGFVVDDAVVVLENVSRHVEEGMEPMPAALLGAQEVGFTVLSMSSSLIAVFIPILMMGGIVGRLLREFALTLSAAIAISLVLSLSTTPMMCAYLLKAARAAPAAAQRGFWSRMSARTEHVFDRLLGRYDRSLQWALAHGRFMMTLLLLTICLNVYLYVVIPKAFFPQQDIGRISGSIQGDQSISFDSMSRKLTEFMAIVRADPAVQNVVGSTGGGQTNSGQMYISLTPLAQRKLSVDGVIARLRGKLAHVPGATLYLQAAQDIRIGGRQSNAQYQFTLQADDLDLLRGWELKIRAALLQLPQLADVNSDVQDKGIESYLVIDHDAAARLGVSSLNIDTALNNLFGQRQVSTIYNPMNQYRVVMEAAPVNSVSSRSLQDVYVAGIGQSGEAIVVPLASIARYDTRRTSLAVNHSGQAAASTISFNLPAGVSLSQATAAIQGVMLKLEVPGAIRSSFSGTAKAFQDSLANEPVLILAALVAVYIVLGILYESYIHPLTIISTLPSAGVGALLALLATHTEFSIIALIGVILLIGIVKKNAIMMIDFAIDTQRRHGTSPRDAIYQACLKRFRPIMMTTMAALFGALPLAIRSGDGAELRQPLGISIAGGLVVSQLLTLYTTPLIYLYLDRFQIWYRSRRQARRSAAAAVVIAAGLGGCAVGPNYVRPAVETPAAYTVSVGWRTAEPRDELPRGRWWAVYGDPELDTLMDQLQAANQTVKQAEAQYRAARALADAARAAYFPTLNAGAAATRTHAGARTTTGGTGGTSANSDSVSLDASWEPDLWGKLRRTAENAGENARATAAELAAARLSAEAELAQDYFQLRITDEAKRLYDANVAALEKSLQITRNQYAVGVAGQADVAQAETLLKSTQAAAIDLAITRSQLEHAMAVLCGRTVEGFSVTPAPLVMKIPNVPLDLPSDLLERRPDIASNERLVAAANANIGVAEAAYFPSLTLSGTYGYQGSAWTGLFSAANQVWSVGPALALNLFDAGARRAATRQARANYDASVAAYRETVLAAFQDVEDNLAALHVLAEEITVQDEATKAADSAENIALNQYKSGVASYLNVVIAQTTALSNERASLTLRGRRLAASVALIKSLGGSWDHSPTPTP